MSRDTVKVYKVTLLVVDHDRLGEEELRGVIERTKYPNRCISPSVMGVQTREVEWSDDHPLNLLDRQERAFVDLFGSEE
jgi:hypothetical protein